MEKMSLLLCTSDGGVVGGGFHFLLLLGRLIKISIINNGKRTTIGSLVLRYSRFDHTIHPSQWSWGNGRTSHHTFELFFLEMVVIYVDFPCSNSPKDKNVSTRLTMMVMTWPTTNGESPMNEHQRTTPNNLKVAELGKWSSYSHSHSINGQQASTRSTNWITQLNLNLDIDYLIRRRLRENTQRKK